jgi:predicted aspartyl protease
MPSLTLTEPNLRGKGPVIEIHVGVSARLETVLRAVGDPVPPPIPVAALIDTGASHTIIQQNLAVRLGIRPIGTSSFNTASASNVLCPQYAVQLLLPHNVSFEKTVVEMPLQGQHIQCLIGRDILAHAVLVYLGESNLFSISF